MEDFIFCVPPTAATVGSTQNICGLVSTALGGNTPAVGTGAWAKVSGPGTVIFSAGTSGSSTATVSVAGTYVFSWTITNGTCTSSASVTVNYTAAPTTATVGSTQNICGLVSTALGGNTPAVGAGAWAKVSGPGTVTFSAGTSGSSTATVSVAGTYVFSWTITNGTCTSSASVTVNYTAAPTTPGITAGGPLTFCAGGSVVLTSSSATGNQWYRNALLIPGETSKTHTATTTGVYTIVLTANGCPSTASAGVMVSPYHCIYLTGNVWNDVNGDAINSNGELLYTAAGLNAILADASNNVVESVGVSGGTYTLTKLPASVTGYKIILSTTAGVIGNQSSAIALPAGFVTTGESNSGTPETGALANSIILLAPTAVPVAILNFGIELLPNTGVKTSITYPNPTGTNTEILDPADFSGTDPDGILASIRITTFPGNTTSLIVNGVTYTSASAEFQSGGNGIIIPTNGAGNPTQPILVDPAVANLNVVITYAAIDNAGKEDLTAGQLTVPFSGDRIITIAAANSVCIQNAPYLNYSSTSNFNTTGLTSTIEWINLNGDVISTQTGLPLSGQVLYPGAAVDGFGNCIAWPGWAFIAGEWVAVNDLTSSIRQPGSRIRITVNPSDEVVISFPLFSPFCHPDAPVVLSGKVWNDADGSANNTFSNIGSGSEPGTNATNQLYVIITGKDPSDNNNIKVLGSTPVNGDGTYVFNDFLRGTDHNLYLSLTPGVLGSSTLPSSATPSGWVLTSPILRTPVDASGADLVNLDFGIQRIPVVADYTATTQPNPGGTNTVTIPSAAFTGSDPEDGGYTPGFSGRKVRLSPPTNGTLYYNGVPVNAATDFTGFDAALITLDPAGDGVITPSFDYQVYDNANVPSVAKTINLPLTDLTISGRIWNDGNGVINSLIDGIGIGSPASPTPITQLYVNLVFGGNVVGSVAANPDGTYTLGNANGTRSNSNFSLVLSTTQGTTGQPVPSALPTGWLHIAQGIGAGDGTATDGLKSVSILGSVISTGLDFGINRLPVAADYAATSQPNPGGNLTVTISTAAFTGSDGKDAPSGYTVGLGGRTVRLLPATNGTLYYIWNTRKCSY